MTLAAEVLDTYARDWQIDETPLGSSSTSRSAGIRGNTWFIPTFSTHVATPDVFDGYQWVISDRTPSTLLVSALGLVRNVGSSQASGWTTANAETSARLVAYFQRVAQCIERPRYPASSGGHRAESERFPADYSSSSEGGEDRGRPDSRDESGQKRAERAIAAVNDLAKWLGVTPPQAADLAGGYRRSYYNWLSGKQPYPAKTLNLFEAHAFILGLVDALGERGARAWLKHTEERFDWRSLLATDLGRDQLSDQASGILFGSEGETTWQPDDQADHVPTKRSDDPTKFGTATALPPAPN